MRNFIDSLKARRDAAKNEGGFSLIDVVVTVAIIVALSVGGFVAYSGIVDSAKQAAVNAAADQVYTAAVVAKNDDNPKTTPATVASDYNRSSEGITVEITPGGSDTFSVKATNVSNEDIFAVRGYLLPNVTDEY